MNDSQRSQNPDVNSYQPDTGPGETSTPTDTSNPSSGVEEKKDQDYNLTKAFRLIICRKPDDKELAILKSYYDEELQLFNQNKLSADTTLQQGEYTHDDTLDKTSTAALMKTIEMVYNMDEAITK